MGSSGAGRISDYPGSYKRDQSKGGGGGEGGVPEDGCPRAFPVTLEDEEPPDYSRAQGSTPPVGTQLEVVLRKRLVAQTASGESVGNLPTSFNYLVSCFKDGWRYIGAIVSAQNGPPVATIAAAFAATPPP